MVVVMVVMMMMMVVVVFDSGAGLRVMGGDGDISSSLYRQTDRQNITTQHQQPISGVRRGKTHRLGFTHRDLFVFKTQNYYLNTTH